MVSCAELTFVRNRVGCVTPRSCASEKTEAIHGSRKGRLHTRNIPIFQGSCTPQPQGVDGRTPRPLSGCPRSAIPAVAGRTCAHGARTRFSLRYFRPHWCEFFADQPGYPFCEGQDAL